MLGGSVAAALFGLSHAFGVRQPKAAEAVEPQRIDFVTDDFGDVLVHQEVEVPFATADLPPEPTFVVEEPVAPQAKAAKAPRKPRSRKVAEEPAPVEEPVHVQLAPLFEPEPFARTQHAVFGRRHTLR